MSWNKILKAWITTKQRWGQYSINILNFNKRYSKRFILSLPADWPRGYYPERLIGSGWNPDISIIPKQRPFLVHLNTYKDFEFKNFKYQEK